MKSITKCILEISKEEQAVIQELLEELDNCPIGLSDEGYLEVIRAIANKEEDIDDFALGRFWIKYKTDEDCLIKERILL